MTTGTDGFSRSDFEGLGPRRLFRRMVLGLSASQVFVAACFAAVFNVRGVHETIRANSWVLWTSIPLAVGFFLALKVRGGTRCTLHPPLSTPPTTSGSDTDRSPAPEGSASLHSAVRHPNGAERGGAAGLTPAPPAALPQV